MGKLARERKALAAAVIGFYMSIYFLVSLQAPAGWGAAFGGLAGVYAAAFFGLVTGYFWARWFALGLGISGLVSAGISIWQIGPEPLLVFYGATHAFISIALWGGSVATLFDGQTAWRERFHLDEHATNRLGKSIIRVGVSLPYIVLYALAPREGAQLGALVALAMVGFGAWALVRMRTWGLLALAGGAAALLVSLGDSPAMAPMRLGGELYGVDLIALGIGGAVLVAAALAPLAAPALRYLRSGSDG